MPTADQILAAVQAAGIPCTGFNIADPADLESWVFFPDTLTADQVSLARSVANFLINPPLIPVPEPAVPSPPQPTLAQVIAWAASHIGQAMDAAWTEVLTFPTSYPPPVVPTPTPVAPTPTTTTTTTTAATPTPTV